jgi:hypothetical protein
MGTHELTLISRTEQDRVRSDVFALRKLWTKRLEEVPFFTLGAASYLDSKDGQFAAYREHARRLNPELWQRFDWLYRKLAKALEQEKGERVFFEPEHLALPGFHIFLSDPRFSEPASVHFDLQYEHIDWSAWSGTDLSRQLSLTLSIRLPAKGAGLMLWDIHHLQLQGLPEEERKRILQENRTPTFHRYREGDLIMHSGHKLHQIAPMRDMLPDDERITLQAHAMPTDEGWLLYW